MAIAWFVVPYKRKDSKHEVGRVCAMDDFTAHIYGNGGKWEEGEVLGNVAIVAVQAKDESMFDGIKPGADWLELPRGANVTDRLTSKLTTAKIDNLKNYIETLGYASADISKTDWQNAYLLEVLEFMAQKRRKQRYDSKADQIILDGVELACPNPFWQMRGGAFPITGILDTFNRSNATSLGANWSVLKQYGGSGRCHVISNQAGMDDVSTDYLHEYWSFATYGPDCEAYLTVATNDTSAEDIRIYIRVINPGDNYDAYRMGALPGGGSDNCVIKRVDDDSGTQLGASFTQAVASGDSFGIACIGTTISFWYKASAGDWTPLASRTDATYRSKGYLGFYAGSDSVGWRYENFGGGSVPAVSFAHMG